MQFNAQTKSILFDLNIFFLSFFILFVTRQQKIIHVFLITQLEYLNKASGHWKYFTKEILKFLW